MIINRALLFTLCLLLTLTMQSQELTVKGMQATNDLSASTQRRVDLNGEPCGLVKVQLVAANVGFEGNVIQPVEYKGGEYWVYMTKGSQELRIKHQTAVPSFVPCHIKFADYGIKGIQPLQTYDLTLLLPQVATAVQTQKLIVNYTPASAMVLIDSKPYKGNGRVEETFSLGSHSYIIAAEGYETAEGTVKLNGGSPRTITENLVAVHVNPATTVQQPVAQQKQPASASTPATSDSAIETITVNGVSFNMVRVESGTFTMGATSEQVSDAWDNEKPAHQITLSTYCIGETEVTQALWKAVMGKKPSQHKGSNRPVEQVSWEDCQTFIEKLNRLTGRRFRLPTEAEWEYAARGGSKSMGYKYSGSNNIADVAWCTPTTKDKGTREVKTNQPNELGLYDMSGNVFEWCQDWFGSYSNGSQTNPTGPSSGSDRVIRGGAYGSPKENCRSSFRYYFAPSYCHYALGLRLCL